MPYARGTAGPGTAGTALSCKYPVKLAHLRASTNLTMPECCVILAAEDAHARVASFDDRDADADAAAKLVSVRN
jgi:hypothetical protein